jgi:hypothetical protein
MDLRFAQRARATKDFDLGIEGSRAIRMRTLTTVLQLAFDDFAFRVKPRARNMEHADTIRVEVTAQYRTRSWQTIVVDLGPAKAGPVDLVDPHVRGLAELRIPVTSPVRCLRLADQVAQKLHACTGPAAAGRARDVLDILLIDALGELNYAEAAKVALRVFGERATHPFPPTSATPVEWRPELESMAAELDFPIRTFAAVEKRFAEVVSELDRAGRGL